MNDDHIIINGCSELFITIATFVYHFQVLFNTCIFVWSVGALCSALWLGALLYTLGLCSSMLGICLVCSSVHAPIYHTPPSPTAAAYAHCGSNALPPPGP